MLKMECNRFLGKNVAVGVPHLHENRPFYFYGVATSVTATHLTLSFKGGVRTFLLDEIIEIRLCKNTCNPKGVNYDH